MSVQIACSTDRELLKMAEKSSYTEYFKALIFAEIKKRNLKV